MGKIIQHITKGLALVLLMNCFNSCNYWGFDFADAAFDRSELAQLNLKQEISLNPAASIPSLDFAISFNMPRDELILQLPRKFLRLQSLYRRIFNLKASANASLSKISGFPHIRVLKAPKGQRVKISYSFLARDPEDQLPSSESFSAPIIRPDYFHFVGLMALIFPQALMSDESFALKLEWRLPENFLAFSSFGPYQANVQTQNIYTNFDNLRDALFVGGSNLRVSKVMVRNKPIYITFEGTWDRISDNEIIDVVARLINEQRQAFGDDNFPYFLVHILSAQSDCRGVVRFAGTAHPNSFRAFLPSSCRFYPQMKQLISHELVHMWLGKKIKVGKLRGHIDGKWFTEGLSDYFGRVLAYRAGVLTIDQFWQTLGRQVTKYYLSKERFIKLEDLVRRMYRNGQSNKMLEDLPYQRGEILAWRLNKIIKSRSHFSKSLDDPIRDLVKIAIGHGGSKNFSVEEIERVFDKYAQGALLAQFKKIVNGETLLFPKLPGCSAIKEQNSGATFSFINEINRSSFLYIPDKKMCHYWLY